MKLLSAREVAERLSVPERTAYHLMNTRLTPVKIGRLIRVEEKELEELIINSRVRERVNPSRARAASALYEARRDFRRSVR